MTGTWSGDNYYGDDSNDVAVGTGANNSMFGNKGDDNLDGAGGDDALTGGVGHDNLFGGAGNDRLWDVGSIPSGYTGLIGHDTLRGSDGDDHLNFWSPDTGDVANGGDGFDTLEVRFNWPYPLSVNGVVSFVLGAAPSVVQYDGINTVAVSQCERMIFVAGDGNDFVTGWKFNDTIAGMLGNDVLKGEAGDDVLDGGKGIQDIDGGKGFDRVSFDLSGVADSLTIESGRTISLGAWGTVKECEFLYDVLTGSGNDVFRIDQTLGISLESGSGDDQFTSKGAGGDGVHAGQGNDTVSTGDGNDYVDPGFGSDLIKLGAGDDRLDYYEATGTRNVTGDDRVYGGEGDDDIYTPSGNDYVDGEGGNDWLYGGNGADTIIGGDGNDTVQAEGGADIVTGGEGNDSISADYDYWSATVPIDADRLTGDAGNDTLTAGQGRDTLDGGIGDDTLTITPDSTAGNVDKLLGGDGLDTLYVNSGSPTAGYKLGIGEAVAVKADGQIVARASSIERVVFWGYNMGDHAVFGGELGDVAKTGGGDSLIKTGGGDDTIDAGGGSDTVLAGDGADDMVMHVGGADQISLGSGADQLVLYDYSSGAELSEGGGLIDGGNGFDTFTSYLTNKPGTSFDGVNLRYNGVVIGQVTGFESYNYNGSTGGFAFTGTEGADRITVTADTGAISGMGGIDSLIGAAGADTLDGGAGDDRLTGAGGADQLTGGADADTFIYAALAQSAGAAIDTITDFETGDRIDLSAIDADTVAFGNQLFHVGGGGGHAGDIVLTYDSGNDRTVVDLYVNNDAVIDGTIWLEGNHTGLTDSAFWL